jgi:phage FluMu protein Com
VPGASPIGSGRAGSGAKTRGDCRCACGNLLARLTPRGIEVKCRRCKRVVLLTVESDRDASEPSGIARAPP